MLKKSLLILLTTAISACAGYDTSRYDKPYAVGTWVSKTRPAPTVIVLHGCLGPDLWTSEWAVRLESWGYNAVVLEQFRRRGYPQGVCLRERRVAADERSKDVSEVAAWIKQQTWHRGNIVVMGMSHGGGTVMDTAVQSNRSKDIKAAVAVYPGCGLVRNPGRPVIPVQVHLGARDTWTPCLNYNWSGYSDVYIYPQAGHAFDFMSARGQIGNYLLIYRPKEAELSRQRIKTFLETHLGAGGGG